MFGVRSDATLISRPSYKSIVIIIITLIVLAMPCAQSTAQSEDSSIPPQSESSIAGPPKASLVAILEDPRGWMFNMTWFNVQAVVSKVPNLVPNVVTWALAENPLYQTKMWERLEDTARDTIASAIKLVVYLVLDSIPKDSMFYDLFSLHRLTKETSFKMLSMIIVRGTFWLIMLCFFIPVRAILYWIWNLFVFCTLKILSNLGAGCCVVRFGVEALVGGHDEALAQCKTSARYLCAPRTVSQVLINCIFYLGFLCLYISYAYYEYWEMQQSAFGKEIVDLTHDERCGNVKRASIWIQMMSHFGVATSYLAPILDSVNHAVVFFYTWTFGAVSPFCCELRKAFDIWQDSDKAIGGPRRVVQTLCRIAIAIFVLTSSYGWPLLYYSTVERLGLDVNQLMPAVVQDAWLQCINATMLILVFIFSMVYTLWNPTNEPYTTKNYHFGMMAMAAANPGFALLMHTIANDNRKLIVWDQQTVCENSYVYVLGFLLTLVGAMLAGRLAARSATPEQPKQPELTRSNSDVSTSSLDSTKGISLG